MVRATVFVSALFALIATVAAVPRPLDSLVDVDADYVGTGDLNFDEAFQEVVDLRDLNVQDVAYDINVLGGHNHCGSGSGCGHEHGHGEHCGSGSDCDHNLLGHILKREEAPAGTVRIAKAGKGKMNKKGSKKAAAEAAAVKMA